MQRLSEPTRQKMKTGATSQLGFPDTLFTAALLQPEMHSLAHFTKSESLPHAHLATFLGAYPEFGRWSHLCPRLFHGSTAELKTVIGLLVWASSLLPVEMSLDFETHSLSLDPSLGDGLAIAFACATAHFLASCTQPLWVTPNGHKH